jgi:flagellar basal-body rod modification protein FlgD
MTVQSVTGTSSTTSSSSSSGFSALGQQDFFKLLTVQMQMQDPFDPVDNKEMLAQMAQFSSLAGISDMGDTLSSIASKLDALIELQMSNSPESQTETPAGA